MSLRRALSTRHPERHGGTQSQNKSAGWADKKKKLRPGQALLHGNGVQARLQLRIAGTTAPRVAAAQQGEGGTELSQEAGTSPEPPGQLPGKGVDM